MNELTSEEITEIIEAAPFAHIGVVANGEPYVTPISYVTFGDRIAFRSVTGKRLDAIAANPRVSVEITEHNEETGAWRSVIAAGHAVVIENPHDEESIIQQLRTRYAAAFNNLLGEDPSSLSKAYIIMIEFDEVTGRSSGAYTKERTRPGRL
jgi:nitroimidazol reductase NimA-like FMN-containing flavoprotein (pyridoxamine 5'-phosphate oxidase superfamily)